MARVIWRACDFRSVAPVAVLAIVALGASRGATAAVASTGYSSKLNYTINCSGCHMADGSGYPGIVPPLRGHVAKYLAVPQGRAFLAQVPGSAQALLSNGDLADVLNWIVTTYDPIDLPANFVPYQADEVGQLRRTPVSASTVARAQVLALVESGADTPTPGAQTGGGGAPGDSAAPAQPPAAFAICAACHSVSPSGDHSIGPNLRGVIGRRSGSAPNYSYSKAMRDAGIVWSAVELDTFLKNVSARVPGTMMSYDGVEDPADRKAIAEYLSTLKP